MTTCQVAAADASYLLAAPGPLAVQAAAGSGAASERFAQSPSYPDTDGGPHDICSSRPAPETREGLILGPRTRRVY
jgi:hypothetical protein